MAESLILHEPSCEFYDDDEQRPVDERNPPLSALWQCQSQAWIKEEGDAHHTRLETVSLTSHQPVDESATVYPPKHGCLPVVNKEAKEGNVFRCNHTRNLCGGKKQILLFYLCFMMMDLFPVTQSALVEFPNNTVGWRNGSSEKIVIVSCRSNYPGSLKWYVQKNGYPEKEALYNGYHLRPDADAYCTVKDDELGKMELSLKYTPAAAQTYICLEPGTLDKASADLIWIKSDPICTDSSSEDLVNLTCSIEFRGNWAPIMEWKEQQFLEEKILSFGVNTTPVTVPNERVTSTLVMKALEGRRNYACITKFDVSGKPNATTATNIPRYKHVWTSTIFSKTRSPLDQVTNGNVKIHVHVIPAAVVFSVGLIATLMVVSIVYMNRKKRKEAEEAERQETKLQNQTTRMLESVNI